MTTVDNFPVNIESCIEVLFHHIKIAAYIRKKIILTLDLKSSVKENPHQPLKGAIYSGGFGIIKKD